MTGAARAFGRLAPRTWAIDPPRRSTIDPPLGVTGAHAGSFRVCL